jgi:hypothetical protein
MSNNLSWCGPGAPEFAVKARLKRIDVEHSLSHQLPTEGYLTHRLLELDRTKFNLRKPWCYRPWRKQHFFYTCNYEIVSLSMCLDEIVPLGVDCRSFTFIGVDGAFVGEMSKSGVPFFTLWPSLSTLPPRPIAVFEFSTNPLLYSGRPDFKATETKKFVECLRIRYDKLNSEWERYLRRDVMQNKYSSSYEAMKEVDQLTLAPTPDPSTVPATSASNTAIATPASCVGTDKEFMVDKLVEALEEVKLVEDLEEVKVEKENRQKAVTSGKARSIRRLLSCF